MKKTRFTDERMVTILREADRRPVPEVAKRHGVSAQTIYSWRKHFGTLEPADVKRLRQLEQENGRLKKMVADRELEIDVLDVIAHSIGMASDGFVRGHRLWTAVIPIPCSASPHSLKPATHYTATGLRAPRAGS